MKELEKEYRTYLPRRSYAVVRVDGKGFSKYTKDLDQPFDAKFSLDMRQTARYLAENIDGAHLAYTQSDEISVIFSDLAGENTEWWFGGQVQKIVSVTAALATAKFNSLRNDEKLAVFDARVHHLNDEEGVLEYLKWRQTDALKNSVGMLASHHFPHKALDKKSTYERIQMLALEKNVFWRELSANLRQGSLVAKEPHNKQTTFTRNGQDVTVDYVRNEWVTRGAPKFDYVEGLRLHG